MDHEVVWTRIRIWTSRAGRRVSLAGGKSSSEGDVTTRYDAKSMELMYVQLLLD